MNEQLKEAVSAAIREALGGALDCGRVWSAWGVGTMSEDDFSPVADDEERVAEIADAVMSALASKSAEVECLAKDADRLDFVLARAAWIREKKADSGSMTYWLETQDEDEYFINLSGEGRFFRTQREAIDAAMEKSNEHQDQ